MHRICTFTIQNFGCIIKITEVSRRKKLIRLFFLCRKEVGGVEGKRRIQEPCPRPPTSPVRFRAVQAAAAKGLQVDLVTVDATISELFPAESAAISNAMLSCIHSGFTYRNVDSYIRIVKELSERRQSIRSVEEIINQLRDPTQDLTVILEKLRTESRSIEMGSHKIETMVDAMMATYDYLEKRAKGEEKSITTGLSNVDALIGGFFGGELTVIGARPSVGKSAFGANIALQAAKKGFKVAVVSREMTDVQFGQRMISHETLIDGMKLRRADLDDEDWCNIGEALSPLANLPMPHSAGLAPDLPH